MNPLVGFAAAITQGLAAQARAHARADAVGRETPMGNRASGRFHAHISCAPSATRAATDIVFET